MKRIVGAGSLSILIAIITFAAWRAVGASPENALTGVTCAVLTSLVIRRRDTAFFASGVVVLTVIADIGLYAQHATMTGPLMIAVVATVFLAALLPRISQETGVSRLWTGVALVTEGLTVAYALYAADNLVRFAVVCGGVAALLFMGTVRHVAMKLMEEPS